MGVAGFIAGKLKIKSKIVVVSIAVSFVVMIVAVSVTSGFKTEIRNGISNLFGDVQITEDGFNYMNDNSSLSLEGDVVGKLAALQEVGEVTPAVYKAGIIKKGDIVQGVVFKGTSSGPDSLGVRVPQQLASKLALERGDKLTVYFTGEKVRVRNFKVVDIYTALLGGDDKLMIEASLRDLQAVCGWDSTMVSAIDIVLKDKEAGIEDISYTVMGTGVASSSENRFPQVFSWLELLDVNVLLILALMTAVAGFNMVSGLLISLFRNISTIGILKASGMRNRSIGAAFLIMSAKTVGRGLLIGNLLGVGLCLLEKWTHFVKLDPSNYFLSYVPVNIDLSSLIVTDAAAFAVIMLMLLLPALFISGVDPAKTIKVR